MTFQRSFFLLMTTALLLWSGFASAQDDDDKEIEITQLETITVTSTKMGEGELQKMPVTATVVSNEDLEVSGVRSVKSLNGTVPSLQISQNAAWGQVYLRGIGTNSVFIGSDPSTTINIDGVYMARPPAVFMDLFDVQRIEVLRGPQGTLYGRNSAGGAINIISKTPGAETERQIELLGGNYGRVDVKGRFSGAIFEDQLFGSFSFLKRDSDGYVDNISPDSNTPEMNDDDKYAFRGMLRYLVSDRTDMLLSVDFNKQDDATPAQKPFLRFPDGTPFVGSIFGLNGPQVIDDPYTVNIPGDPNTEIETSGIHLTVTSDITDTLRFTSITAYRESDADYFADADFTEEQSVLGRIVEQQSQFTQEFQLNGYSDSFDWVGGVYLFFEEQDLDWNIELPFLAGGLGLPDFVSVLADTMDTVAAAAFFQGDYRVNDRSTITAGLRLNYEEKDLTGRNSAFVAGFEVPAFSFDLDQKEDWTEVTPKLRWAYELSEQSLLFFDITRGFKSGGFNNSANDPPFDPELVWSYEVGLKNSLMDDRVRFNASAFIYDYEDLQVQSFVEPTPEQPTAQVVVANAADAEVSGLELELAWLAARGLTIDASLALLDAEYDEFVTGLTDATGAVVPFDASGNKLNSAPETTAAFSIDYRFEVIGGGEVQAWVNYRHQDDVFYTAFNQQVTSQDAYGLLNANFGYRSPTGRWTFSLFGQNLNDETYYTATADLSNFGTTGTIAPPRMYGAKLGIDF